MPAAPQLRVRVDTSRFNAAIREYARVRRMDIATALERSAKKFCFRLAKGYFAHAATEAKIWGEAKARSYFTLIRKGRDAGRVLRTPAAVNAELKRRSRVVKMLGASFLFRGWRTVRGGARKLYTKAGGKSRVIVQTDGGNPRVTVASSLEGVVVMDRKHGIWNRAVREETADLNAYLRRKEREAAEAFKRA